MGIKKPACVQNDWDLVVCNCFICGGKKINRRTARDHSLNPVYYLELVFHYFHLLFFFHSKHRDSIQLEIGRRDHDNKEADKLPRFEFEEGDAQEDGESKVDYVVYGDDIIDEEEDFLLDIELNDDIIVNNIQGDYEEESEDYEEEVQEEGDAHDEIEHAQNFEDEYDYVSDDELAEEGEERFSIDETNSQNDGKMELSVVNSAMLKLLQIKKQANLANVHYDAILQQLYRSGILKEELLPECPYSTEEVYRNLGMKSEIGDFVQYKVCSFRCKIFEQPRNLETYCDRCQTSRLGIDSDLDFYSRSIKSIFLRFWKKRKFRECFIRNNPTNFIMDDDSPIAGFNSAKLAKLLAEVYIHVHTFNPF